MNINEEEKSVAQRTLDKFKEHERKKKLIPVKTGKGISVMMKPGYTKEQLEVKREKYLNL